jgi:hypothetical protein
VFDAVVTSSVMMVSEEARMAAIVGGLTCASISRKEPVVGEITVDLATVVEETKVFDAVVTSSVVVAEKINDPDTMVPWQRARMNLKETRNNLSS